MKKNSEKELKHGEPPSPSLQLLREEYLSLVVAANIAGLIIHTKAEDSIHIAIKFAYTTSEVGLREAIRNWRIHLGAKE
jgi:hypothetical protein